MSFEACWRELTVVLQLAFAPLSGFLSYTIVESSEEVNLPISFPKKEVFNWESSTYIVLEIVYFLGNFNPSSRSVSSPVRPLVHGLLISNLDYKAFFRC